MAEKVICYMAIKNGITSFERVFEGAFGILLPAYVISLAQINIKFKKKKPNKQLEGFEKYMNLSQRYRSNPSKKKP